MLANYFIDQGHEVHWLANGHIGKTISYSKLDDGTEIKAKIYGRLNHQYFADLIPTHLKKTKSDIFLIVLDTFMLHGNPSNPSAGWFLNTDTAPSNVVFWYPSDGGGGMPVGCDLILKRCNSIAYSKFAQKQVKDYYNLDTKYIPLGTDTNLFIPYDEQKRQILKAQWGLTDKYVVGCVARNQPRKFLDREIKAFKLVADKIPNAVLFLHTDPNDMAQPFSLLKLIQRYNLENRVRFSGMNAMNSFGKKQMVDVYNLMDVFFLSTSGEGWGIPFVEAMSCGIPVVATDYTTTDEIVTKNKAGYAAKLAGTEKTDMFKVNMKDYDISVSNGTLTGSWEVERGFCDINDAANKIIKLADPVLRKELGQNGRNAAVKKYDMYKVTAPKFMKLFEELTK